MSEPAHAADLLRRARVRVAEKITDLIGETPLVRLRSFDVETPGVELWAKCEFMNPGGSVKDRAAYQMIGDAIRRGELRPGQTIIDATSGNTGIAYSLIGGALGHPVTLVMPANVSWMRRQITAAFGTEIVLSDALEGSDGAIKVARRLVAESPGRFFYPDQYSNPSNPLAHYNGTGREIWEQTEGRVTHFVAGVGTSGTVMGTGRRLKDYRRDIEVWAVEPDDPLHGLEGLKHMASSLVPALWHPEELNGVLPMATEEAWAVSERLGMTEGLLVGHSSGAALAGALRLARRLSAAGRPGVVVTLFPDRADRYLEAPVATQVPVPIVHAPPQMIATHPTVPAAALAEIFAHARESYPRECCGVVYGGRMAREATRVERCRNVQDRLHAEDPVRHPRDARTAYALDARDLFAVNRSFRGAEPARVIYHSHVETGSHFSDMDQAVATFDGQPTYAGVEYLVVEVRADGVHGATQYAWNDARRRYEPVRTYAAASGSRAP